MGKQLIKCSHCDFIDYLNKGFNRCPKCGSSCNRIESQFEEEFVSLKTPGVDGKSRVTQVTFLMMEDQFNSIMGKDIESIIKDEFKKDNMLFMAKVYVWLLLKKQPQLWLNIDMVVSGLKEIFTLRVKSED